MRLVRRIRVAGVSALLLAAVIPAAVPARAGTPDPGADFNGDGYADLAVGVPREDLGSVQDAGGVEIIYGTFDGLNGDFPIDDQFWTQNSSGVQEAAEPGDLFGSALAVGDFDGDGFDDLAIGVPWEDVATGSQEISNGGIVQVLYGSSGGLTSSGDQLLNQDTTGIADLVESGDLFGSSLEAAQFGRGLQDDLAIGSTYEDIGTIVDAGVVNVVYGASSGLVPTGNQIWHQSTPGVPDTAERADHFGRSLASGDFGRGSGIDLAVGVPDEDYGGMDNAGAVAVIYSDGTSLAWSGSQSWTQNSPGIAGSSQASDYFGWALAAGDLGKSSHADLAIGSPYEDVYSDNDGYVNVIYGTANGLSSAGSQAWHQNVSGISGDAEAQDLFGYALVAADFGKGGHADLAIGVFSETAEHFGLDDLGTGAVNVIYGAAGGLGAAGQQFWWQDSSGIEGETEPADRFGGALAAGNYGKGASLDLAIGVPNESYEADDDNFAGAVNVIYSGGSGLASAGDQFWWQASDTLHDSAETSDHFAVALGD